jgi:hypothetical protein
MDDKEEPRGEPSWMTDFNPISMPDDEPPYEPPKYYVFVNRKFHKNPARALTELRRCFGELGLQQIDRGSFSESYIVPQRSSGPNGRNNPIGSVHVSFLRERTTEGTYQDLSSAIGAEVYRLSFLSMSDRRRRSIEKVFEKVGNGRGSKVKAKGLKGRKTLD